LIVVKLFGGLGNQMFQYACGRGAALRAGTELAVDTSWFMTQSVRRCALAELPIQATVLSAEEAGGVPAAWTGSGRLLRLRLGAAARADGRRLLVERTPGVFDERALRAADGTTLVGYWQSERYFSFAADQIRSELTSAGALSAQAAAVADEIRSAAGVAVHIRRGDYTSDSASEPTHGTCPPEYYRGAMSMLDESLVRPSYFAFSDDPDWVRETLPHPRLRVVSTQDAAWGGAETDMRLMSMCRAHVISNSTFGWWGAWLSGAGTVIAPSRWFADPALRSDDIVPRSWLRL
jgi:hypothetical protein